MYLICILPNLYPFLQLAGGEGSGGGQRPEDTEGGERTEDTEGGAEQEDTTLRQVK